MMLLYLFATAVIFFISAYVILGSWRDGNRQQMGVRIIANEGAVTSRKIIPHQFAPPPGEQIGEEYRVEKRELEEYDVGHQTGSTGGDSYREGESKSIRHLTATVDVFDSDLSTKEPTTPSDDVGVVEDVIRTVTSTYQSAAPPPRHFEMWDGEDSDEDETLGPKTATFRVRCTWERKKYEQVKHITVEVDPFSNTVKYEALRQKLAQVTGKPEDVLYLRCNIVVQEQDGETAYWLGEQINNYVDKNGKNTPDTGRSRNLSLSRRSSLPYIPSCEIFILAMLLEEAKPADIAQL